jgi:hypothetical protein
VPCQFTHWLDRGESRYSGVIADTSVSTIISGKARAATPINVCTGKGAVPKFLARHWPYGTRFFMSVRYVEGVLALGDEITVVADIAARAVLVLGPDAESQ